MRCGSTRPTAPVTAFLCAFLLAVLAPLPAVSTTVTIGTSYNKAINSAFVCSLYTSGLDTAAKVRSGNGLTYSVTSSLLSSSITVPQAIGVAQDLQKVADAIFGFAGTFVMGTTMNSLSNLKNIMFFGPFAESESNSNGGLPGAVFSQYYSSILWTIPLDGAQSLGLLYYLAQRPSFPRSQLALIQNSNSGPSYYGVGLTAGLLFALEMPKLGVTQYQTAFNGNGYTSAVASKPGVVYMFGQYMGGMIYDGGSLNPVSLSWMQQMVVDSTLIAANSTVVTTFYIQYEMMEVYQSQLSAGKKMLPAENVMSSAPTPGVDAMEYQVTQDFHSQVTRFPGCSNNACKNYVLAGWVGGTALLNAMYMYGGSSAITSSSIYDNLIPAQSSFLVSDLFIGSFGPQATTCSAVAESQGAVCHCNQAGMNIFFTRLTLIGKTVDVVTIPGASFQYAKDKCASVVPPGDNTPVITPYTELVTFSVTKQLVGFRPSDNAMMSEMCSAASAVSSVLSDRLLYRHLAPNGYAVGCIDTKMAAMSSSLASHVSTYVTTSLTGVIPDAVISSIPTPSTFVLDFMPQTTQPRVMQSNLVYLFPTLDQELYVLASYLHGVVTASSVVCGVVSTSSVSPAIVTLVSKSLTTYGMTVASGHMVQTSGVLVSSIPSACTHTFVVGLGGSDAAVVATYLESHPSAVVLLSFDDVTKYYSSLQTSVGGQSSSVTDRVLFATNLPSWTATPSDPTAAASSAPLSTVSQFLQSVPDSLHTPAAVRAFIVAMMYDMLSAGHGPNPDVQQLLYDAMTVRMNGVVFGPFSAECYPILASSSGTCVGNAGATGIAVWSYTRVVTPETPLRVAASTPSVVYYIPHVSASVAEVRVSDTLDGTVVVPNDGTCVNYSESSSIASGNSSGSFVATVVPTTLGPLSSSRGSVLHPILPFTVDDVLLFLCVAVIVVALTLMILLLWKYNVVYFLVKQVNGCCAGCGDGVTATVTSPAPECDDLRERAMDASRLTATDIESRTVVVVVVEHWRPLWVRAPEVMRRVVAAYQRCVREAVVLHGCVEARSVGGLFVLVCPTASAALLLVGDIHCGLMSMSTRDRDALSSVYRSFGVVDGDDTSGVRVLRIRVGVDTSSGGGACGSLGNGLCSEACVVVATRAAYRRTDWAGLCVMTERTRSGLSEDELSSVHLHLVSAGLHALHCGTEDIVLELFVLSPSVSTDVYVAASLVNESSCEHALQMQLSGVETYGGLSSGLCASTLVAFCSGLHTVRVSCLERLLQYFVLPAVSGCAYADEDGYVDALLCAVSVRLGALLECRHGFLPGELRHCGTGGVSRVRNRECRDGQDGRSSAHGSDPGAERRGAPSTHTRSRTVMLRRFAYGREDVCDECGGLEDG